MKWAIHQLHPLPSYVHERVILVGDAVSVSFLVTGLLFIDNKKQAHAMTPHQGAGAGQAVEVGPVRCARMTHLKRTFAGRVCPCRSPGTSIYHTSNSRAGVTGVRARATATGASCH